MRKILVIIFCFLWVFSSDILCQNKGIKSILWKEDGQIETIPLNILINESWDIPRYYFDIFISEISKNEIKLKLKRKDTLIRISYHDLQSVMYIPKPDGEEYLTEGEFLSQEYHRVIKFSHVGDTFHVKSGQLIKLSYDSSLIAMKNILYISYKSNGYEYVLELSNVNDLIVVEFDCLCDFAKTATPTKTKLVIPNHLRFEQIIWTPTLDEFWEVRIGSTERGCKSNALNSLQGLRSKDYEENIKRRVNISK